MVAFERRNEPGGVWSMSKNANFTSALDETVCNVSKFIVSKVNVYPLLPPHYI